MNRWDNPITTLILVLMTMAVLCWMVAFRVRDISVEATLDELRPCSPGLPVGEREVTIQTKRWICAFGEWSNVK